jgi:hypothetical protein
MTPDVEISERYRGVEGATLFRAVDPRGSPLPGLRVGIVGHTHGNEPVGGHALARFAEACRGRLCGGSVLGLISNLEARALNLRHTPTGRDMNRLWHRGALARLAEADPATLCYEERRVLEVAPLLMEVDVVLDLHSTSRPSRPHLVFRDDLRHAELASRMGVRLMVTGLHEGAILEGGLCPDLGLDPGEAGERLGFTLEAGQHSNPENAGHAWDVVVRMLHALGMWSEAPPPVHPQYEMYEVIERFRQAPAGTPPYRFAEPGDHAHATARRGPVRTLESFEPIEADEVLLARGNREVVRAEAPFTMLMPAPTAKPGEDLFYFCQRRHAALQARPQTDEAARVEAAAIERFLDLLADDEGQRGGTQISFQSRRTLDLCAELVTRVVRLPAQHPHRRLVVVGRGIDPADEAEARTVKRYQQAFRRARSAGVPIDRVQLLRGASYGWLRDIAAQAAEDDGALRLFLSTRHPHTVSLLIAGDPELAFAEGDFHQVRVALLIEATAVEPEGDEVRTHITRAGMFGARPELVRMAMTMVRSLQQEHRDLLASGLLGRAGQLSHLLDTDGALHARGAEDRTLLGDVLARCQMASWREALRYEVTRPLHLDGPDAVGRWLARVMVSTGILDAEVLRALVLRPEGEGWRVDPELLQHEAGDAEAPPERALARPIPSQVLEARDTNRDTLERWIGWKRFVREVQTIPGTRGRDIDLAFAAVDVRARLMRWFDEARALAAREPGRWQLVIAGDGLSPGRDGRRAGGHEARAHRELLLDSNLRYKRIQHVQGTHLSWMKGFIHTLARRAPGGEPISLCWEAEHGGTINVVLLAKLVGESAGDPWSLESWSVERCAVVLHGVHGAENGDEIAMFTEPDHRGLVNQELLHFGRAHCEGLLKQAGWRISGRPGPALQVQLDQAVVDLIGRYVALLRRELAGREGSEALSSGWVAQRLGIVDGSFASALTRWVGEAGSHQEVARRIWASIPAWAGDEEPVHEAFA